MEGTIFDQLADLMVEEGAVVFSPSELHGVLTGQLIAAKRFDESSLAGFCASQIDLAQLTLARTRQQIWCLYDSLIQQLESSNFELKLLLPDEDQSLSIRAEHLGLWVSGFLSGFGMALGEKAKQLSTQAQDSLKDLVQIAQIENDQESEEASFQLMEVEEYVRMAVMFLFIECNQPANTAQGQVVH